MTPVPFALQRRCIAASVAFLYLLLPACYDPKFTDGTQKCGPGGACPSGLVCGPGNFCFHPGALPPVRDLSTVGDMAAALDMAQCSQATCGGDTPICDPDSGQCVPCVLDSHCPGGQICKGKQCVAGCSQSHGCADGGGYCDVDAGACRGCKSDTDCGDAESPRCDLSTGICAACQPANDNCPTDQYCVASNGNWQCQPGCKTDDDCNAIAGADGGIGDGGDTFGDGGPFGDGGAIDGGAPRRALSCCAHQCVDLTADASNCGKCGGACPNGNTCCAGSCADTANDPANCGRCGATCSGKNAMWQCANSACAITMCVGDFQDCNVNPADGCEVDVATDPGNCTGCGKVCSLANASPACVGGCVVATCDTGFIHCDNNPNDGCEIHDAVDVGNCGACNNACPPVANGVAGCLMGKCGIATCDDGFMHCGPNINTGCETHIAGDVNNCGGCNAACGRVANGTAACVMGACTIGSCAPSFAHCDPKNLSGCETNIATDNANCGKCGVVCGMGTTCTNGACVAACANQIVDSPEFLCVPAGKSYPLSGDHCYSQQAIINGTLTVTAGASLVLRSPTITVGVGGVIAADAAGQAGGLPGGVASQGGHPGAGPGAGCAGGPGSAVGQGGSGGGNGGSGGSAHPYQGSGMCDRCDLPTIYHCWGTPGAINGTPDQTDVAQGSGGGAGGNSSGCTNAGGRGGAGGGSVLLLGKTVKIDGVISAAGEQPPPDQSPCGYHPGGGGGSGGTVAVRADALTGAGSLVAPGGKGGTALGQNNDWGWSGGGGGGGRVKIFAPTDQFSGVVAASAGAGGTPSCAGGYCYTANPGASGTTSRTGTIPQTWLTIGCGGF